MEWKHLPGWGKGWFLGISLLYVVLGSLLGGLSFDIAYELWHTGKFPVEWRFSEPSFMVGWGCWTVLILAVQIYRVYCSHKRSQLDPKPMNGSFLSVQLGLHFKCLVLLILPGLLAWGGGWAWRALAA